MYRTRKNNLATAAGRDPSGNTCYRAANQAKTHGWEIEVGGRITPEWQIQAGYSQSKTRDQDGSRLNPDSVPERSFRRPFGTPQVHTFKECRLKYPPQ